MNKIKPSHLRGNWLVADVKKSSQWLFELDRLDQEELLNALDIALKTKKNIYELEKKHFPLRFLSKKINLIETEITNKFGFVLVRNFPLDNLSIAHQKVLFWGFCQYLGFPEKQDLKGSLMHTITDTGKNLEDDDNTRGFETNRELQFHTDGADLFALLCSQPSKKGGMSKLVSSVAIFQEIMNTQPSLAKVLQKNFYFDTRGQLSNGEKFQKVPIFVQHDNGLISGLHKRKYIETAQRFSGVPKLTSEQINALNMVDRLCADSKFCFKIRMLQGDIQIAHNATTFHSRERYVDYHNKNKKRLMFRLWISMSKGRPLPRAFKNTREWQNTFKRREAQ